jgi:hypothetical protein
MSTTVAAVTVSAITVLVVIIAVMYYFQCDSRNSGRAPPSRSARLGVATEDPVDVVFTWCKHEPKWAEEKKKHVKESTTTESGARNPLKCDGPDDCEIHFAVKSVQRFMPWVRTIWILTHRPQDPQIPGTRVIFHDQVVQDSDVLPTFNSHAIETFLHHIPGLAEKFIYFNDDCFAGRPVTKDLFYDPADGRPFFYTQTKYANSAVALRPLTQQFGYRHAWRNLYNFFRAAFGYGVSLQIHQARPLTKSICYAAENAYPDIWAAVRRNRLRDIFDIPPIGFVVNYACMVGGVVPKPANAIDAIEVQRKVPAGMKKILKQRPALFCVNNVPDEATWAVVKATLQKLFS